MLLEVGRITKAHGVRGDVLVALSSDRTERLDPGSVLVTDRGPLTVESSSRHNDRWIVHFRSEEHTSELQSLLRNSYAVFCSKTKKTHNAKRRTTNSYTNYTMCTLKPC